MFKAKHLALVVACCAFVIAVPTSLADESQPSTTPTTTTPTPPPPCDASCQLKRDYGKLRRSTSRHPIPDYIVACESRGNLHALNPSGAGGRYQIMPSTWSANLPSRRFVRIAQAASEHFRRPGHDAGPQWSGRLLQDKVAAAIAASSGLSPWSCA